MVCCFVNDDVSEEAIVALKETTKCELIAMRCAGFDRVALAKAYEVGFTVTCGPPLPTPSPSPLEKYTCAYRRRWTQACAGLLPVCGRRARRHAVHVPQPEHLQGQCAHAGTDKSSQCQRLTPTLSALAAACGGYESS